MVKRQLVLYVDSDNVEIAKAKGINLSQMFNDILKEELKIPKNIENGTLDYEKHIKKLEHDKALLLQQTKSLQKQIEKIEVEKVKKEKEDYEKYDYEVEVDD